MNCLIIGGGSIGKRHIRNLQQLGYTNIACLKRSYDSVFETENKVKVITAPEAVDSFKPDVVFICTPTSLHTEGIAIAARSNAAIFMEKPLIHNEQALKEATALLQNYPQTFFIGFMLRYHPMIKEIQSLLWQHTLGAVYCARFEFGSYLPYWHPWEDHTTGYAARKELGGGVINTITHEMDLVLSLFGIPETISCTAANFGKLNIDVEEIAEAVFAYPDKLVTIHVDYLQKDYDRQIKILCDEGSIVWNWHENRIAIKKHNEEIRYFELKDFDVNQLYLDELIDFMALAANKKTHHPLDFNYAVENTKMLLHMHASVETGRKVEIK
jgi:predicted dehydrogenase